MLLIGMSVRKLPVMVGQTLAVEAGNPFRRGMQRTV